MLRNILNFAVPVFRLGSRQISSKAGVFSSHTLSTETHHDNQSSAQKITMFANKRIVITLNEKQNSSKDTSTQVIVKHRHSNKTAELTIKEDSKGKSVCLATETKTYFLNEQQPEDQCNKINRFFRNNKFASRFFSNLILGKPAQRALNEIGCVISHSPSLIPGKK